MTLIPTSVGSSLRSHVWRFVSFSRESISPKFVTVYIFNGSKWVYFQFRKISSFKIVNPFMMSFWEKCIKNNTTNIFKKLNFPIFHFSMSLVVKELISDGLHQFFDFQFSFNDQSHSDLERRRWLAKRSVGRKVLSNGARVVLLI